MSPEQFAAAVRTKYPDGVASDGRKYSEIPDAELTQRVINKFPVYADKVKMPGYGERIQTAQEGAANDIGKSFQESGTNLVNNFDELKKKNSEAKSPIDKILNTLVFAGHTAGDVAKTAGDIAINTGKMAVAPLSEIKTNESGGNLTMSQILGSAVHSGATSVVGAIQKADPQLLDWVSAQVDAHPDIAKGIGDLFHTLALTGAGKVAGAPIKSPEGIASTLRNDVESLIKKTADKTTTTASKVRTAVTAKNGVDKTIEAVNPDLAGVKKVKAYQDIVTGKRTVKNHPGWITEQTLNPSDQAVKIGTRLHDAGIALSGKATKDAETLHSALKDTEAQIGALLKGNDPSVVYNADKQTLFQTLNTLKSGAPREVQAIKESKAIYNNVVDFANHLVNKTDDTVAGIRDARTAFDARARIEYPSAFKDGVVDTKTPAGQAIKAVRDSINEHLYNTAPEGSKIRELIQREADIFRAGENIAVKAAKGDSKTKLSMFNDFIKGHPYYTAGGVGLGTATGFKFLSGN